MCVGLSRQGRGSKATQWQLFGRTHFDGLSTSFESLRVSSLSYFRTRISSRHRATERMGSDMSSGRFKIAPTEDELQAAESMIEALLADTSEEREQNITAWKQANMPTVRKLLQEQFDMVLDQMAARMESDKRRESMSQTLQRQFPRFEVTVYATFQGVDGKRMVRKSPEPSAAHSTDDGDWDDYDDDDGGRTPNDDRSDSMNPENDSYQAAMDNHADQMNPNNDAYWSSRG